jgi:DNA-binding PadR family transcriptional regulator
MGRGGDDTANRRTAVSRVNTSQDAAGNLPLVDISIVDIIPRMRDKPGLEAVLPLPEAAFHILVALAEEDRHGYAILQEVAERTRGRVRLGPGTLYRSIQRMLEQGLIEEPRERPAAEDDDERRRYYRITALGRAAARAEATRLASLVRMARASGLAPRQT